jgi:hypothetical protein
MRAWRVIDDALALSAGGRVNMAAADDCVRLVHAEHWCGHGFTVAVFRAIHIASAWLKPALSLNRLNSFGTGQSLYWMCLLRR